MLENRDSEVGAVSVWLYREESHYHPKRATCEINPVVGQPQEISLGEGLFALPGSVRMRGIYPTGLGLIGAFADRLLLCGDVTHFR
jgi:hypothetical protein